ncbi:uncharacterized protein HKW66_Vig0130620 [Vigna angularis]|uniref:Knottin scorpion toxin-like domain-containing protein n=1 Tax=Phaseolus angularis TaxID=3914 RepID=A0A8T0K264_PHAAN|nr:uncharacterized protein LOC108337925 [Vigna angularis]KAG2391177.1 uncharacterized protein HKW66_Vig0130620 [Vigna angularis]
MKIIVVMMMVILGCTQAIRITPEQKSCAGKYVPVYDNCFNTCIAAKFPSTNIGAKEVTIDRNCSVFCFFKCITKGEDCYNRCKTECDHSHLNVDNECVNSCSVTKSNTGADGIVLTAAVNC